MSVHYYFMHHQHKFFHNFTLTTFMLSKNLFNLLKPSGFFTYHQVEHKKKILHGAHFALSVLYGSQNRQLLLLYTSLTEWFL